ncbi:MAG: universal stress protein [Pseudomonadota bacterium]
MYAEGNQDKTKERYILVGVDGSKGSKRALEYLALIFEGDPCLHVDMLHILPTIPPLYQETPKDMQALQHLRRCANQLATKNLKTAQVIMENAGRILEKGGMNGDNVRSLIRPKTMEIAREFLARDKGTIYDALMLGRRGITWIEELCMGSVTNNVLQLAHKVMVCMVDGKIQSKKLLIPVDGSPNSEHAIQNAAWLIRGSTFVEATIIYVVPPLFSEKKSKTVESETISSLFHTYMTGSGESILAMAKELLMREGISPSLIRTHLEKNSFSIAHSIINFAKEHDYGSILLCRRGISKTRQFFLGSVSSKLIHEANSMAIWVVS